MKNILCKLATSVVFILQITNINLGYSSAQVYYGDNYRNYEREYKASENNDFVNNINMYSNNTRLNFDEQYQNNILKYLEKDVLNNDLKIIVNNEYISSSSGSGGSGGNEEEKSNLIQESSIKNKCGASVSCADSNTKTCCDFLRNICNKFTSCIFPGSNSNKEDYSPINEIDEQNDSHEQKPLELKLESFDYFAEREKKLKNKEEQYKEEFEESIDKIIKDSEESINKIMEDSKKRIYAFSEKLSEKMKIIGKEQSIFGTSNSTNTCYDFLKNTFNKIKSYILPSSNNEDISSQIDEEEMSLMSQDDDITENNTNLQMNRNNEIELTPQGEDLQISQTNEIALMSQGELKKIDAKDLYISVNNYTPK